MKHNRHLSTCVYMSIIAISDNMCLLTVLFAWCLNSFESLTKSPEICIFIVFLTKLWSTFGAYEIVLMTLDKTIAIQMPHRAASICTARRAKILSLVNFLISVICYSPFFLLSAQNKYNGLCVRYKTENWFVTAHIYGTLVLYPILPFLLLTSMNVIIIKSIWRSLRFRGTSQVNSEVQLTTMLLLVSIVFVCLTLPFEIRGIYYNFWFVPSPKKVATAQFVSFLTKEISNMNFCINFFLYSISGSKFRADLISLLCNKRRVPGKVQTPDSTVDSGIKTGERSETLKTTENMASTSEVVIEDVDSGCNPKSGTARGQTPCRDLEKF